VPLFFVGMHLSTQLLYRNLENHLDLSGFDSWYKNDKGGSAAYPPSVMLKIILFAYSRGLISSRRIARACKTNITFMSLSGDIQPHYTSIASFVAQMKDQIEPLFEKNLKFMATTGLDVYIADKGFRSRNPLFQESKTYQTEKTKNALNKEKANLNQNYLNELIFTLLKSH
jgi:hypothetical protein